MGSKYISLVYWTVPLVWLQSGRKENIVLKLGIRGSLRMYRCWMQKAAVVKAGCSEIWEGWSLHCNQIQWLAGHLQEDSAGGLLSPWKHWLDQGYTGANYRTVSLGGPVYWKMVRGATVSAHWAESHIQYASHRWMHHEWTQLRNSYKRAGISGKCSNTLSFLFSYHFSIRLLFCLAAE